MEKAYDLKVLGEKLKARGLDLAEEGAKIVVEEMFSWLEESCKVSPNKYDDLLLVVMPIVKPEIMKQVDKIDGKEG